MPFHQRFSHLTRELSYGKVESSWFSLAKKLKSKTNLTFKFSGNKKQFEFNRETLDHVSQSLRFCAVAKISCWSWAFRQSRGFSVNSVSNLTSPSTPLRRPLRDETSSLELLINLKLVGRQNHTLPELYKKDMPKWANVKIVIQTSSIIVIKTKTFTILLCNETFII